ncbi:chloroplast ascorbate hydrogen peroxidase, precursor [Cyanidioschyzon merolae strain 10D]|jgi:L-ascorbate peroxidase|uniref:Chloroplast ascorbate hydrogen peroxidase n=2 Tax=Cyanidioschyzon merolae TaxID=45157 RepID=A0A125YSJ4_CYAM1|nr:chloroplast ascorbate hydrogen peroxidase, precursor [Cyanidioschyzon merolae strain 10D]BAI45176.1 ascorbate peroxidase [Cyanidioschyzon merolae strain 10D]BAM81015.1 chloroplast ascorbate hydrogen peroxidase, precursor [Cyanidioschyzon merolae strain 10D]|eukprot:XP_005537051.1 chloroplast ascorbate hydrogen peroxidase, precursor [Cyanidioschyzon merolae strain 10D]
MRILSCSLLRNGYSGIRSSMNSGQIAFSNAVSFPSLRSIQVRRISSVSVRSANKVRFSSYFVQREAYRGAAVLRLNTQAPTRRLVTMAIDTQTMTSVRNDLVEMIKRTKAMPILVRLAWHDSGDYDARLGTGGANGSIRFNKELQHGGNVGLPGALNLLKPIKEKYPNVGWADLIQYASVLSIEVAGGPKIPFRFGRVDAQSENEVPPEGRLPAGGPPFHKAEGENPNEPAPDKEDAAAHLRRVFYRMGFNDQEIVALSGGHTIGRAYKFRSGFGAGEEGTKYTRAVSGVTKGGSSWTPDWLQFNNMYFKVLMDPNADPELLKLVTDKALVEDPEFNKYVKIYATDEAKFFEDYANAHKKLSELGSKWDPPGGIPA